MLKFITELGPVMVFFGTYKLYGIMSATFYMLIAAIISIIVMYFYERKINKVNIISAALLLVTSSMTLLSGNTMFIKMKPTILHCVFALIFLVTHFKWKPAIQFMLGHTIKFKNQKSWYILNFRFMLFFLFMALMNEIVWRNFEENTWVNFKLFAAMPITIIFMMTQIPFIMKHKDEENSY